MATPEDWKKPFGRFTKGNARLEIHYYIAGSGGQIQSTYIHDGSVSLADIRDKFLAAQCRLICGDTIVFEGTLLELALHQLRETAATVNAVDQAPEK